MNGTSLASVTRLRVRAVRYLAAFLWMTFRSQRQVIRSPGFVEGRLLVDARRTFWTLTVWESEKAMKAFRGSGAHAQVMARLAHWCNEAAYAHWTIVSPADIPSWPEAYNYLVIDGKLSRVNHPSADHESRQFAKPRLKPLIEQNLKP